MNKINLGLFLTACSFGFGSGYFTIKNISNSDENVAVLITSTSRRLGLINNKKKTYVVPAGQTLRVLTKYSNFGATAIKGSKAVRLRPKNNAIEIG